MVWMTSGASFTNRSGSVTGTAGQDFPPSDVGLASQNGWVASNQNAFPGLIDVPGYNAPDRANPIGVPSRLFQSNLPMAVSPTGSMANNGVVTLGTALPTGFFGGPCYLYLPANAIVAASTAGWYYTVMTSTTVGTVYNQTYTSGQPFVPSVLVPFTTTGPGAYTGVTTAQNVLSFSLGANSLGLNGVVEVSALFGYHGSVNNKTALVKVGASTIFSYVNATAANIAYQAYVQWGNQCQTGSQSTQVTGATGPLTVAQTYTAIDTTQPQTITVSLQDATATDWISLESFSATVTPG